MSWRDKAFENANFSEHKINQLLTYETNVVKQLLAYSKQNVSAFKRELRSEDPEANLTLGWFRNRFPDFPVILGCQKIQHVYEMDIFVHLIAAPTKTKLWQAFARWCDETDGKPKQEMLGLVFEMSGVGTTIIHNFPRTDTILGEEGSDPDRKQGRFVRPIESVLYSVEPFKAFLRAVGNGWVC